MSGVSMDFGKIDTMSNSANTWYGLWKTFQYAALKKTFPIPVLHSSVPWTTTSSNIHSIVIHKKHPC